VPGRGAVEVAAPVRGSGQDRLDAVWLAKVAERQMLRPSFVPPGPIRLLRDLTRYRAGLVKVRTAEKNRVEKLLEDAQIKLSSVVSDIFGVSGRQMLAALLAGERRPAGRCPTAAKRSCAAAGGLGLRDLISGVELCVERTGVARCLWSHRRRSVDAYSRW
jgi:Transposase